MSEAMWFVVGVCAGIFLALVALELALRKLFG